MRRIIPCLSKTRRIGEFLTFARFVLDCMRDNPHFPELTPSVAEFEAHLTAAERAHVTTLSRLIGAATARNADLFVVKGDLGRWRTQVESAAREAAGDGLAIVEQAGFNVKQTRGPGRALFEVKQGKVSGSVVLLSRSAGRRASYYWQYRPAERPWLDLEPTVRATTTKTGLTPGTRYSFRTRARTAKGLGDWSDVISMIVV